MNWLSSASPENISLKYQREKTVCFSGHRPEKLPCGGDTNTPEMRRLLSLLSLAVTESIDEGYTTFITGMSRGIDLWAGRMVLEKKLKNPSIKLICAVPFRKQGSAFKGIDRWDYGTIAESADDIYVLADEYKRGVMQFRNEFMVKNSAKLIAVVANMKSGTGQTIRMAQRLGLETRIIDINKNSAIFTSK